MHIYKNSKEHIYEAFDILEAKDQNGTGKGYILLPTLRRVLTSLGEKMSTEELDSFIKDMDIQDDEKVTKDKFLQAFDIENWN